jgi:3-phenylpropionate/trans-cinnamate dioxygenase ferredoxin reductase subunit
VTARRETIAGAWPDAGAMAARTVVIVGAGLAGSRCAETLRAEGFDGRVVLVGDEALPPYERPALSKEFLAGERDRIELRPRALWDERDIELVLGHRVQRLDLARRTYDGGPSADALVIATGSRARTLPGPTPPGVLTLRTVADAERLRAELKYARRLAIVGAGFVGAEVASTACGLGVEVTLVDLTPTPLARVLGEEAGAVLAERYRSHGVDLRMGVGLSRIVTSGDGRVEALELADGSVVPCDVALIAIGAAPASELLGGDTAGIETDACGRTAHPGVFACGDVASAWRPSMGAHVRVEHWTSAAGQAASVANAILGRNHPYDDLPYFWSDQFGVRLQHVGHPHGWETTELEGDESSFCVRFHDVEGRLLGALVANRPREVGALRREVLAGAQAIAA